MDTPEIEDNEVPGVTWEDCVAMYDKLSEPIITDVITCVLRNGEWVSYYDYYGERE